LRCPTYVSQNNPEEADCNPRGKPRENLLSLQRDARVPWRAVLLAKGGNLPDFHKAGMEGETGEMKKYKN